MWPFLYLQPVVSPIFPLVRKEILKPGPFGSSEIEIRLIRVNNISVEGTK